MVIICVPRDSGSNTVLVRQSLAHDDDGNPS